MTLFQTNISTLYSKLNEFRINDKFCDVTIRVDEESFKCHRLILAATCEYFDVMFGPNFKEGKAESITLENIDAAAFAEMLMFVYTGKVIITPENVHSLIVASDVLGLSFIEKSCIEYIQQKIAIPIKNIVNILLFARVTMKQSLTKVSIEYIVANFYTVSKTDEFLDLTFEDFRSLLDQYQDRIFPSLILSPILRWVHHSRQERILHFPELINIVGCEKISPGCTKFIVEKLATDATISSDDLMECIRRNAKSLLHVFIELRFENSEIFSIFSLTDHDNTYKWRYSCTLPKIYAYEDSSRSYGAHTMCVRNVPLNDCLYSLNFDNRRRNEQNKFYAASSIILRDTYHTLKSPPVTVSSFEMCTLRNSIYLYNRDIFQRYGHRASTNVVSDTFTKEELARGFYGYDPIRDEWFSVAPLKEMVSEACLTADNNSLYMVGGSDHRRSHRHFQAYDSRTSQWRELPACDHSNYINGACCVHEGKIFVCGGFDEYLSITSIFDLVAGKWQSEPLFMTKWLSHDPLVSHEGRVWAIGNDFGGLLSIEVYEPMAHEWCDVSSALQIAVDHYCIDYEKKIDWLVTENIRANSDVISKFIYDAVVFNPLYFSLE